MGLRCFAAAACLLLALQPCEVLAAPAEPSVQSPLRAVIPALHERLLREARESHDRDLAEYGADSALELGAAQRLANVQFEIGDLASARETIERLIRVRRAQLRDNPTDSTSEAASDLAASRALLADILDGAGDAGAAEREFREAAEETRSILGNDGRDFTAQRALAAFLRRKGRYEEAEAVFHAVAEGMLADRDWGDFEFQLVIRQLVDLQAVMGLTDDAVQIHMLLQQQVAGEAGPASRAVAAIVDQPAYALTDLGKENEAFDFLEAALAETTEQQGPDYPAVPLYLDALARVYAAFTPAEGEQSILQSLEARHRISGDDAASLAPGYINYASMLIRRRKFDEARSILEAVIEAAPASAPSAQHMLELLGSIDGEGAAARGVLLESFESPWRLRDIHFLEELSNLASLLHDARDYEGAELAAREGARLARATVEQGNTIVADFDFQLAAALRRQGRLEEAWQIVAPYAVPDLDGKGTLFDAAQWYALAAEVQLDLPERATKAYLPIRFAQMIQQRLMGDTRQADSDEQVNFSNWRHLATLEADGTWARVEQRLANPEAPAADLALFSDGLGALQRAGLSATDRAVGEAALRAAAARQGGELQQLVAEREAVLARYDNAYAGFLGTLEELTGDAAQQRLAFNRTMTEATQREAEINAALAEGLPELAQLRLPQSLTLAETQALLAPDEAILVLVPTERGTHTMAIDATTQRWLRSSFDADAINARVRSLLWDVGGSVEPEFDDELDWNERPLSSFDRTSAYELYRELVAPQSSIVEGKARVYVVATGSLSTIPLGILVAGEPEGDDGDAADLRASPWLADRVNLVMLPSLQALRFLRTYPEADEGHAFVGFGNPVLGAPARNSASVVAPGDRGGQRLRAGEVAVLQRSAAKLADPASIARMASLPGTATELRALASALSAPDSSVFMQQRATEAAFKSASLGGLDVLAIATHGLLAEQAAGVKQPGLVFTPPGEPTALDDGYLTAAEIAALRIEADWVILSACNTAGGSGDFEAPALSGLARAFILAGSRNLLVSHWPVFDEVAPLLTVGTIRALQENPSVDRGEALRLAAAAIRNDTSHDGGEIPWSHPRAWAPFSLVGEGGR